MTSPRGPGPFSLISWNINSVRRRLDQLERIILRWEPDVICLQELKAADHDMPSEAIAAMGYPHQAVSAEAGYNGVAIVSKTPLSHSERFAWAGGDDARHVCATVEAPDKPVIVHCVYVPAGGDVPDRDANPKFDYKLRFLDALSDYFAGGYGFRDPMILTGDFNVAPLPSDVWDHSRMRRVITHTDIEIAALERLKRSLDWIDTQRQVTGDDDPVFTWWSYRAADWETVNKGRRLDHIWVTPGLKDRVADVEVLTAVRHWTPPSDHAPVRLILDE